MNAWLEICFHFIENEIVRWKLQKENGSRKRTKHGVSTHFGMDNGHGHEKCIRTRSHLTGPSPCLWIFYADNSLVQLFHVGLTKKIPHSWHVSRKASIQQRTVHLLLATITVHTYVKTSLHANRFLYAWHLEGNYLSNLSSCTILIMSNKCFEFIHFDIYKFLQIFMQVRHFTSQVYCG